MQNIQILKELLTRSPKRIVITTHQKPDADALGSSLALFSYLKKYNHYITVITPTDYPQFIEWMSGNNCVINYEQNAKSQAKADQEIQDADLIFMLDFSSWERLKNMAVTVEKSKATKILMDHHLDPTIKADFELWNCKAAATCELMYDFICMMGDRDKIDLNIGECIYAGIMTDTGSFRFPSTSKKIHLIIADLIDIGVNNSKIHRLVYDNNSFDKLRFLGFVLSQKMHILENFHTAYIAISKEELDMFHSQTGDTEGLVNYALSIEGIIFAAIIIERPEAVKLSFRSSGDFPVNEFAHDHFKGGGHKNAAGGISDLNYKQTLEKFLDLLPKYKQKLINEFQPQTNLIPC